MRRRLTILLLFLPIGVAANWLAAVACCLIRTQDYEVIKETNTWNDIPAAQSPTHRGPAGGPVLVRGSSRPGADIWYTYYGAQPPFETVEIWYGWPLRTWRDRYESNWGLKATTWSIEIRPVDPATRVPQSSLLSAVHERIPLMPRWKTLPAGAILYAAALWPMWSAPRATMRALRARRGRCPKCGYDLARLERRPCPECGAEQRPRQGASAEVGGAG